MRWLTGAWVSLLLVIGVLELGGRFRPQPPDEVQPVPPSTTLLGPVAAVDGRRAVATVDESYTYDLILTGVPLRAEPFIGAELTGRVEHGERLVITCWREGEMITNGDPASTYDDEIEYLSDVWWLAKSERGEIGFISDVWLGRTAGDRLGTDRCPED